MNKTIRWWEYIHNGWVKLTLKPDTSMHHHYSARDEEGYSFSSCEWTYEDGELVRNTHTGGRDCDGEVSFSNTSLCRVDELSVCPAYRFDIQRSILHSRWDKIREQEANFHDGRLIHRPAWRDGKSSQYDQEAERAGY